MCDGYSGYNKVPDAKWTALSKYSNKSHARRRFDEAVKALPKAKQKDNRAYFALTMIQAICREEKLLRDLPAEERRTRPS